MLDQGTIDKALALIRKRGANHQYFFSKLNSPEWLEPLDEAGLFSNPPVAVRTESGIIFPIWAESRYLVRVAEEAPERVLAIMERMEDTDNVRVHCDLAEAATRMNGTLAEKWAKREVKWIESRPSLIFLLPEAYGSLAVHLADSGRTEAALELLRATLTME